MVTVLLVGALGVAGVGWLKNRIGLLTLGNPKVTSLGLIILAVPLQI